MEPDIILQWQLGKIQYKVSFKVALAFILALLPASFFSFEASWVRGIVPLIAALAAAAIIGLIAAFKWNVIRSSTKLTKTALILAFIMSLALVTYLHRSRPAFSIVRSEITVSVSQTGVAKCKRRQIVRALKDIPQIGEQDYWFPKLLDTSKVHFSISQLEDPNFNHPNGAIKITTALSDFDPEKRRLSSTFSPSLRAGNFYVRELEIIADSSFSPQKDSDWFAFLANYHADTVTVDIYFDQLMMIKADQVILRQVAARAIPMDGDRVLLDSATAQHITWRKLNVYPGDKFEFTWVYSRVRPNK